MELASAVLTPATISSPPFALAGGWGIFLIILIVLLFAVIFGYSTVGGSGITLRPYRHAGEPPESPPQIAHDITSDVRNWERGTDGHHRRYPPAGTHTPPDPEEAEALKAGRATDRHPQLDPPLLAADHARGPQGATTVTLYLGLLAEPSRSAIWLIDALA